ncbi:rhodanese-like domain-containing protein [Rhodobacter ferrooxidans]|uniref:Rhodanese domain protein n=1 Tax=Rhodobacter ferrooxidans TaxID=371731 RepID=C8RZI7_9RHOB|nr:rhodanese-like domain-containing protein [Rhodobacter sp. SW2]EEW25784.1 Rhodanese domain protein [Rhodobacter sp. SW2]
MFSFLKSSGPKVQPIAPADAVARVAKGEVTLIDVREVAEVRATGKAKGALHIPLSLIKLKADPKAPDCPKGLSVDKPVVLYCLSGARSQAAGQAMLALGYGEVYNLGGFSAWQTGGGKVVPA